MRRLRLTVLAAATLCVCAVLAPPALATFPGKANGRIAYAGMHDGKNGLFTINPDGSDVRTLVQGFLYDPAWAPHGEQVAWETWSQIGLVKSDGSGWTMLTDKTEIDFAQDPTWSPDGTKLAFVGQDYDSSPYYSGYGSSSEIYTIDVDGTNLRKVTDTGDVYESSPSWSPDGTRIAYTAPTFAPMSYSHDVYTIRPDGTDRVNLTKGGWNESPNWAPDSSRIVFNRSGVISTMSADGSDHRSLGWGGGEPVYSPDGTTILFGLATPYPDYTLSLVTMPVGGGALKTLTAPTDISMHPDWQPLQAAPDYSNTAPVVPGGRPSTDAGAALRAYVAGVLGKTAKALRKAGLAGLVRGVQVTQPAPSAGTLTIDLLGAGAGASAAAKKKLRIHATGRATAKKPGKLKVRVKATKAGRKALKRAKRMKMQLRVTFKPKGAAKVTRSTKVILKRRK